MSYLKTIALCVTLLLVVCAPPAKAEEGADPCAGKELVDWSSQAETIYRLQVANINERFRAMDEAMACLSGSTRAFAGGESASSAIYTSFRSQPFPLGTPNQQAARTVKWTSETGSIFAEFSALRQLYDAAWAVRGHEYAQGTAGNRMDAFSIGLAELETRMLAASPKLRDTAIWHRLLLAVSLEGSRPKSDPHQVFAESIRRWPEAYEFQQVMLAKLVPRWGGSWPAVDAFVKQWASRATPSQGESLYARLYVSVLQLGYDPGDTLLDSRRMASSLRDWKRRYPSSDTYNVVASAACAIGDKQLFREVYLGLKESEVRPTTWLYRAQRQACVAKYG